MAEIETTGETRPDAGPEESAPIRVLAILVTHEGRPWLKDALVGLKTQTYEHLDVLVVDDASPSGRDKPHLKRIAKRHLQPRRWGFVRTPRPLGFGGAINWALSRVRTDADLLLFIHDDAALDPGAVEAMVTRMSADPKTGIVGPKIVSWDDPARLEEVGMAIDRFGYPYKGLEQGEIDLGQHDVSTEVFYVTSTCMLIRHDLFRQSRGWDARMRAFSEDLDLCWRARLAGWTVRVEPAAKARHAIALATGQRPSRFLPARYFIRRNRLRTVVKNASAVRLLGLAPQFILLALLEMLAFIVLRQPREIGHLARALGWNLITFPQAVSERARAQRQRKVQDRDLHRFTVRQSARVRVYVAHQADRLEEAWGRRAEFLSQRTSRARAIGSSLGGRHLALAFLVAVALVIGFRHFLWGPSATVGELLPFPERATALWRSFFSPWQTAGLGYPGPAPPAFLGLGLVSVVTFGTAGVAQKLLVASLGLIAFIGAYRLLRDVADRSARIICGAVYTLGAVGYAGLRTGHLGALVFGAAAPFALLSLLRLTGWSRPAAWDGGREMARAALAAAVSAAFVPGALFVYAVAAVIFGITRATFGGRPLRSTFVALVPLIAGWGLLLPWSASWWSSGGILDRVGGDATWRVFAENFHGHSILSALTGQTPDGPALAGIALPVLGIVAAVVGEGQRRRIALVLWTVIASLGLVVTATSTGLMRPVVASPTELGVVISIAFAALAGLAVAAFRLDLPRKGLGVVHALTLGALALSAFMLIAGTAPTLWHGEWTPGGRGGRERALTVESVRTLLAADAGRGEAFRTVWVGEPWTTTDSAMFPLGRHVITGPRGRVLPNLFESPKDRSQKEFQRALASIEEGATDRGGALLGAFNVRYVVLPPGEEAQPWLAQRDLELIRSEPTFLLLRNTVEIARAAVYSELPVYVKAIEDGDPRLSAGVPEVERTVATQVGQAEFVSERASGPGVIFVAEASDPGWTAASADLTLRQTQGGWGNAFELPEDAAGRLVVSYPRSRRDLIALLVLALAWIVVLGGAFSRRKRGLPRRAG